jgi:hypothetical protein
MVLDSMSIHNAIHAPKVNNLSPSPALHLSVRETKYVGARYRIPRGGKGQTSAAEGW